MAEVAVQCCWANHAGGSVCYANSSSENGERNICGNIQVETKCPPLVVVMWEAQR